MTRTFMRTFGAIAATVSGLTLSTAATAQSVLGELPIIGQPTDGATGFQPASSSIAEDVQWLDGMLLVIITLITLFVTGLIAWVIIRYNAKRNPNPATFTHNSPLEVAWTVVPIVILVFIGAFSLPVLFDQQEIPEADITIKVTGKQWFWEYEYVDEGIDFESFMIGSSYILEEEDQDAGAMPLVLNDQMRDVLERAGYSEDQWLLATDTSVVVPVGATIVMQVTGGDVIHSWTIPAFGVKQDGVPGRLAELWFAAEEEGVYFGQCSELCGMFHAYMPITVKVVSQEVYDDWLALMQAEQDLPGSQRTLTAW